MTWYARHISPLAAQALGIEYLNIHREGPVAVMQVKPRLASFSCKVRDIAASQETSKFAEAGPAPSIPSASLGDRQTPSCRYQHRGKS
jgi:hypothetical protein